MGSFGLQFLNVFFLVFHTGLIVLNCLGWIWRRSRRLSLITLALTAVSWLVMGIWHGVGYCICTDWHWQVRTALGYHDPEHSYIDFLVRILTGRSPDPSLSRAVAGWVFAVAVVLTVSMNIRDWAREKKEKAAGIE